MPAEGQTAVNPKTGQRATFRGGQWVVGGGPQMPMKPSYPYEAPQAAAGLGETKAKTTRTVVQTQGDALANIKMQHDISRNPVSEADQKALAAMRETQGDLAGLARDVTAGFEANARFKSAPGKGKSFDWFTPDENDWPITAAAKNANFNLNPFIDATERDRQDYQTMLSLQNQAVLNAQLTQKGPQTESDAARMKLTAFSPNKASGENARILSETLYDTEMRRRKLDFYTKWANKNGSLSALNKEGKSADEIWREAYDTGLQKLRKKRGMFGNTNPSAGTGGWGQVEVRD